MPADYRFGGMIGPMVEPIDGPGGRRGGMRGRWWNQWRTGRAGKNIIEQRGRTDGPIDLKTSITNLQKERESFAGNRTRSMTALANAAERGIAQQKRNAALTAAQADRRMPTSYADAMSSSTRRAKVRQGIVSRGEAAIRNQQMKDRLKIAQGQASRRGALINTMQTAAGIREGVNVGVSDANNRIRESQASMWGSIAGSAARIGKQWWDNRGAVDTGDPFTGQPQSSPLPQQDTGLTVFGNPYGGG